MSKPAERDRLRFIAHQTLANLIADLGNHNHPKRPYPLSEAVRITQEFERDGFDATFLADFLGLSRARLSRRQVVPFEPLTLLSALAATTERIGLVGTATSVFEYPYNLARRFASLEHISNGRSGWNAVTSFNGEKNFGYETIPTPEERYEIGSEFIEVVTALWASWDRDALIEDRDDPRYSDPEKIHDIHHQGKHFSVEEGLDIPPSPQGRPVIFQAGASDSGIEFAARYAEAVFVAAPTIEHGKKFYERVKSAAIEHGRDPNSLKVVPGLYLHLAPTEEEANARQNVDLSDDSIASVKKRLAHEFPEFDLEGLDLELPIPAERIPTPETIEQSQRRRSRIALIAEIASAPNTTLREFIRQFSLGSAHYTLIATPERAADELEQWFREDAADGFVLIGEADSYELFVHDVLPRLRDRGIWWPPTASTLRENLGIGDPVDSWRLNSLRS